MLLHQVGDHTAISLEKLILNDELVENSRQRLDVCGAKLIWDSDKDHCSAALIVLCIFMQILSVRSVMAKSAPEGGQRAISQQIGVSTGNRISPISVAHRLLH